MNPGRAGYAPIGPVRPPSTVDLLFAGHELGRIEIHRTRLHPHARSLVSSHGADPVECIPVMSGQATPMVDDVPQPPETGDAARFSGHRSHHAAQDSLAVTHTLAGYSRA
ncbi:hypothetical protein ACIA8E_30660 [Streptomyces sp. NPDC051664]|uniref:hypothetical protein n=1 Tax=Streptomyces sp. NPDC051664 TaxID=3365668 RepID=UPI0037981A4A